LALAIGVVAAASLLGSRQPATALATVLTRSSAALAHPEGIVYVAAIDYGGNVCLGEEAPIRCIGDTGINLNADPAQDPVSFTYQEWTSAAGPRQHTIYGTGDETVSNGQTRSSYDPANNTLTTTEIASSSSSSATGGALPEVSALTISDIESIYRQAQAGEGGAQLIGQTNIGGESAYELRIVAQESTVLLYVDAQTFLPVRAVLISSGRLAAPRVADVTNFVAQSLPDTPSNEALLDMSPHTGATGVELSEAQLSTARSAVAPVFVDQAAPTATASGASRRLRAAR
jgi:hypothetical protein